MQPKHEVAHILREQWPAIEESLKNKTLNGWQVRTLSALGKCRTQKLGGHIDGCTSCLKLRISYNSCRNRRCPKCQGNEREAWIEAREKELLPIGYFHTVFTLPSELNSLCMRYPALMYNCLFDAAWDTINTSSKDEKHLGATTGMISILHTWGQQMTLHPHLHCIIPGGGLTKEGSWKHSKTKGNYLFPVRALSKVYRAKYFECLRTQSCFRKEWVVYTKKPISGAPSAVEYLGRYTHKVAISNHRITAIDKINDTVTFKYKDYKTHENKKFLQLSSMEFVRHFALHILPKGFVRIRHYGILSSTAKVKAIDLIRKQLPALKTLITKTNAEPYNPLQCPCCKKETMIRLLDFDLRRPPTNWKVRALTILQNLKTNN